MAQDLNFALQLQRMDQQLAQLQAEIRALPKRIAELEKQIDTHQRQLETNQAELTANQAELRRLTAANADHKEKIEKLKKQVMKATTQEQLTAFQHEIAFCEVETKKNEETALRLLEEAETLMATVQLAEAKLAEERVEVEKRKAEATVLSEEDRKKGVRIYREREKLSKEVPPTLLKHYERLRAKYKGGIVVAECTEGLCTICMMNIRAALLQQIRTHPEQIFCCESCLRMLSYNPVISIEGAVSSVKLSS